MTSDKSPQTGLFTLRIILSSLLLGVVSFAAVAIFLTRHRGGLGGSDASSQAHLLLSVLGLFGLGLLTAYPLVRRFKIGQLQDRWRGEGDLSTDPVLFAEFQTLTIVGAAMAEGFCLFSLVIYLVTGHPVALVACAVGLVPLVSFFPTENRLTSFASAVAGE